MKNIKRKLTALALSVVSAISFVGCSAFENIKSDLDNYFDPACTHIDENTDNVCDSCGATIATNDTTDTPATDTETHVCTSENDGFYCDTCGNVMPAVVLEYYATEAECEEYPVASDLSCSALCGEIFKTNATDGLLLTFQSPDGYECSVTLLSDGTLDKDGASFIDGIYTYTTDSNVYFYIPADFTVQFYDSTANAYVTRKFSECTVFYCAGDQLVDVSNQDEKELINLFANNQIEYDTYAIDTDGSPLYAGMSCIEMLGYVYRLTIIDGTYFTVKTSDGTEINVKFSTETMTLSTDYGEIDDGFLMKITSGANFAVHILLSGDLLLPISDTETVNFAECTLVSTVAEMCVPKTEIK